MSKKKIILPVLLFVLLAVLLFCFFTRLVSPKYSEHLVEGSMTGQYYDEDKQHDLIIIGDCEVYANISPMILWEQFGITSYVRGNSQQLIWQSYYILKETLRYETPDVVVLSVGDGTGQHLANRVARRLGSEPEHRLCLVSGQPANKVHHPAGLPGRNRRGRIPEAYATDHRSRRRRHGGSADQRLPR